MTDTGSATRPRPDGKPRPLRATEALEVAFEPLLDQQLREFISASIDYHSIAATGLSNFLPVNLILRGACGDVLGGLIGQLWGHWLHVSHLWVAEAVRGVGQGTKLMQAAEHYARARGAVGATLETFSFQARPFYERLGYELFGMLEGYPPGHAKYFLRKSLAA